MGALILPCDVGQVSDGYHSFNELYDHRCLLFLALMRACEELSWASKFHSDGSQIDGWFIAGMSLPTGEITYHLPLKFWDLVTDRIAICDRAPEWDGHTSEDVIKRLIQWLE